MTGLSFGQHLRSLRHERGITQAELAERVDARVSRGGRGFDVTYLSKIENGILEPPSILALTALADELDTDAYELIALAGKVPPAVGDLFLRSRGARSFWREALALGLSDRDWDHLAGIAREAKGAKTDG